MTHSLRPVVAWMIVFGVLIPMGIACADPKPGEILVGVEEDEDNYYYYYMSEGDYVRSGAGRYATQFCRAKLNVTADQNAISALGLALEAERFQMIEGVAKEQLNAIRKKLFEKLLDTGLDTTGLMLEQAKSLNPWNVNTLAAVKLLKNNRFSNATIVAALRRIAEVNDKPAKVAAYKEFIQDVKNLKAGWKTAEKMEKDPENKELTLLLGALKVMQGNKKLGLLITTVEFGEHMAYLYYLSGEVEELTKTTDEKLSRLAALSERLKGHVKELNASREAWRKATGFSTASPICDGGNETQEE